MFKTFLTLAFATLFVSSCGQTMQTANDPLFKDVAKCPPKPKAETIEAISKDPTFGRWVIYQSRASKKHGCTP